MKKFFEEFKKFVTRGNVVDMAVGVIVGSSFTAIVNGLSNFILKPIINWLLALIFGKNSLSEVFTFLTRVDKVQDVLDADGNVIGTEIVPDLTQSIYIDWGSFISAIINFLLIAFVLFSIVRKSIILTNYYMLLEYLKLSFQLHHFYLYLIKLLIKQK